MSPDASPSLEGSELAPDMVANASPPDHPLPSAIAVPPSISPALMASASLAGLPDPGVILSTIERGLDPNAEDTARLAARDLWSRLSVVLSSTMAATAVVPTPPGVAVPSAAVASGAQHQVSAQPVIQLPTTGGGSASTTPIGDLVRTLRQVPPDQLLDLVIGRLRAALPAGVTAAQPRGIQFQLVPVTPSAMPSGSR